ncbi:MAG: hypothetical protein U9R74_06750 [Pseudomonadota bacterium]|nr:hypothetical protein [Pseudomonadota bacterium]
MGKTDNKMPPEPPGFTAERMLGFIVPFLIFLVAIVIALDWDHKGVILWVFAVSLLMIGIYIFTAGGNHMPPQRVTWMFRFAYAYTLMALIGSTVPFMRADWTPFGAAGDREQRNSSQVRVLRACACPAHADGTDDVPRVVQCDDKGSAPWVLNVGGTVYPAGPCVDRAAGAGNEISGAGADPGGTRREAEDDTERDDPTGDSTQEAAPGAFGASPGRPATGAQVRGGLVVPFYVIVLAVVGGAVSMTRRVPEYQKRVCRWYEECTQAATYEGDVPVEPYKIINSERCAPERMRCGTSRGNIQGPLSPSCVRDCLVFQMMQVAAAPFIAVVAYYALSPRSVTVTVLLAFLSGFTSETILYLLRSASNRLTPVPEGKAPGGGDDAEETAPEIAERSDSVSRQSGKEPPPGGGR